MAGQQQEPLEVVLQNFAVSDPDLPELLFNVMQVCTSWRRCVLTTYNKRLPVCWEVLDYRSACTLCQWLGTCIGLVKTLDVHAKSPRHGAFMELLLGECRAAPVEWLAQQLLAGPEYRAEQYIWQRLRLTARLCVADKRCPYDSVTQRDSPASV